FVAGKRDAVLLALEEILTHLRANNFQKEAEVGGDRVAAQNRVLLLEKIAHANQRQKSKNGKRQCEIGDQIGVLIHECGKCRGAPKRQGEDKIASRKRKKE